MTLLIKKPAVLFEGGPWDGWARFEDEMDSLVRCRLRAGDPLPYRRTERFAVHPRTNGKVHSRVWEYCPEVVEDPWA